MSILIPVSLLSVPADEASHSTVRVNGDSPVMQLVCVLYAYVNVALLRSQCA